MQPINVERMRHTLAHKMGRVVRLLRIEADLSQEDLAARCGLHRTYIGSIERGEKTITIETAHKLATAFGVALSHLFIQLEAQEQEEG